MEPQKFLKQITQQCFDHHKEMVNIILDDNLTCDETIDEIRLSILKYTRKYLENDFDGLMSKFKEEHVINWGPNKESFDVSEVQTQIEKTELAAKSMVLASKIVATHNGRIQSIGAAMVGNLTLLEKLSHISVYLF